MKLRTILLVLALLAFLSASIGGYQYYASLRDSAFKETDRQAAWHARRIRNQIFSYLSENQKAARTLGGLKELQDALQNTTPATLARANSMLDHFQKSLGVSVCYLMDQDGSTIASSNRHTPTSFVGKNYAFRPYFQQAIQSNPTVYMALGVTSNKRGVYYSHPVYDDGQDSPLGVVVIKASVKPMERNLSTEHGGIALLTDPHGVIFLSSRKDWLYNILWKASSEEISQVAQTRQFGKGPWNWTGIEIKDRRHAVDKSGNEFLIYQMRIDNYPGWNVVYMISRQTIHRSVIDPLIKSSGSIVLILCILTGLSVLVLYGMASQDIVQRRRAEEALRLSERKYRSIFNNAQVGLFRTRLSDGKILECNERLAQMFGYKNRKECISDFVASKHYLDPGTRERMIAKVEGNGQIDNFEARLSRKDGSTVWVRYSAALLMEHGYLEGVATDITDVVEAAEALRESEGRFRTVFMSAPVGIAIAKPEGEFITVNESFCKMLDYTEEELVGMTFIDITYPEDRDETRRLNREVWRGERSFYQTDKRYLRKDGHPIWATIRATAIRASNGEMRYWVGIVEDISERKKGDEERERMQVQLRQAQKMEAIGTLAGGIAHDFNNLLQAIQGYAELLLLSKENEGSGRRELQEIIRVSKRAGTLTQQLLTFSRKVESNLRPIGLNHEVEQVRGLLERTIPKMINIQLQLAEDLNLVNADAGQVEQVLMNLAVNAKDAMPDGGKLTIRTQNVVLNEGACLTHAEARPGEYVLLAVTDTGHGMVRQTLERIFDPFYTTKGVAKGTGLGLSIVYGIVKNHDGFITCSSEPGQGTTFGIYFPKVVGEVASLEQEDPEAPLASGTETVLVVDDEAFIRDFAYQILNRFGYRVLTAPDGERALEVYRETMDGIDLVILDLIMPGMGGRTCLVELLKINPQVKVLITSGYSPDGPTKETLNAGARGFVSKPFEARELLKRVRGILDEA
jgi:PAS domain S-box-containing protein